VTEVKPQKVILMEINEITWDLIDPLIEQGKLPTFAKLKRQGAWGSPMSVDLPPQLDPWITWTTVYTGKPQAEHNVYFLQQPPDTIKAKRIWEYFREKDISVGIYGSLCSWPPVAMKGFHVPDTFSPDNRTYPPELHSIQDLNLTYTRSIRLAKDTDTLSFKAKLAMNLMRLGLTFGTIKAIVRQLLSEKRNPDLRWKRVVLQPMANFDFFKHLYRRHQPRFATFHTNHVAHYQHTYWKAMQPNEFLPLETTLKERKIYGSAIEFGYQAADRVLAEMIDLMDQDTVLVVASSMGQKPFKTQLKDGKKIMQIKNLDRLLEILQVKGKAHAVSMMSDQFNIYCDSPELLASIHDQIKAAYVDTPDFHAFSTGMEGSAITCSLRRADTLSEESALTFPATPSQPVLRYGDLVYITGHVKSGCHDPKGMIVLFGPGIRAGAKLGNCDNLDIAPTIFSLMGEPIPDGMKGHVLEAGLVRQPEMAAAG
jgi:predicted AlkP superfamily phosphohydrolase/phosphomutase